MRTLKSYILGNGRGFKWNKPIVSYLGYGQGGLEARMGYAVTLEHKHSHGNKAILFKLDKDPENLNHMTNEELQDNFNDYFDVVALNNQPGIIPGKYGLAVNANKDLSEATLQSRKYFIESNPSLITRIREAASITEQKRFFRKDPLLPDELDRAPARTPLEKGISSKERKLLKDKVQPKEWMVDATKRKMQEYTQNVNYLRQHVVTDKTTQRRLTHIVYQNDRNLLKNDETALAEMDTYNRYYDKGPLGGVYISNERVELELQEIADNIETLRVEYPNVEEILKACREDFAIVTAKGDETAASLPLKTDIQRRNRDKLDRLKYN